MTKKAANVQEFIQLSKLQELSSSLLHAKKTSDVAAIIIEKGFDALGADCGEVALFNKQTKQYEILAHKGYDDELLNNYNDLPEDTIFLTDVPTKTKKAYYIENIKKIDKRYAYSLYFLKATRSQSAVILPMEITDTIIGFLQFMFHEEHRFSQNEKKFMKTLADQCAQALDKIIALENAKQAKDELSAILRGMDDAIIVRNAKGEITYVNPAAVHMHGYKHLDEMLRMPLDIYFAQFSKILDVKGTMVNLQDVPFQETMKQKKRSKRIFYKILRKSNIGRWLEITSLPVMNTEGEVDHIVSVMHDITEEKQNEYSKDEFFGIASHELKTPVTTLKAYAQVLEKRFRNEGNTVAAEVLHKMDGQVDKLTNLIRDLLDVTKIEGGKLQFHKELFEFNTLVKEIIEEVQLTAEVHKIIFKETSNAILFGDRDRVGQVITNLLTNAIKYSPEQAKILVKVQKKDTDVLCSVQDFGIGITEKDQKHIFERFYREKNLRGDTFPGLGLGLYIASEIIKRQQGRIWVESQKGEGSIFSFSLPLAKPLQSGVTS